MSTQFLGWIVQRMVVRRDERIARIQALDFFHNGDVDICTIRHGK